MLSKTQITGSTESDLLTIPDREVWAYGQALREMATKYEEHIEFSRLKDLVRLPLAPDLEEVSYVANATNFRRALLNQFGKDDMDVDREIRMNEDTLLTYCGYTRFLENDLRHIYPLSKLRSNHKYKRDVKLVAKEMIKRGHVSSTFEGEGPMGYTLISQ